MMTKDNKFILSFVLIVSILYTIGWGHSLAYDVYVPEDIRHLPSDTNSLFYITGRLREWLLIYLLQILIVWRTKYFSKLKQNPIIYFILVGFLIKSGISYIEKVLIDLSRYKFLPSSIDEALGSGLNWADFTSATLAIGGGIILSSKYIKRFSFKEIDSDKYNENKNYIYMKKSVKFKQHWNALRNGLPSSNFGFVVQGKLVKFNRKSAKLEYVPFHNNSKYCLREIPTSKLLFEHNVNNLKRFYRSNIKLCKKLGYNVKQIFRN